MNKPSAPPSIARGPGPRWFRFGLVALALVYYGALVHHPPDSKWVRPAAFFTDATCLFPRSDVIAQEYRLEVWVCGKEWALIDPQPYFPIRPDDKESRFQRLAYFYHRSRPAMQALDAYVSAGHAAGADDGVPGRIGGIRLVRAERPLPAPGDPVERYHFDPRAPIPPEQRHDVYYTPRVAEEAAMQRFLAFLGFLERHVLVPQPIARLVVVRIAASLAIVGFMSSRIVHADDWLSVAGFRLPEISDYRQPLALPGLPEWAAWAVGALLAVSGLATAAGAFTRWSSGVFAALLAYVALADRLEAFTVSKLAPMVAIVLCVTPSGARASVDAWRLRRRDPAAVLPDQVSGGCVLFFQVLLPVFYFSSGLCKARGDWKSDHFVLWTHLHDSYQTAVSWFIANHLPVGMWTALQRAVLVFEAAAPVWFGLPWTRPYALVFGVGMHLMIGLMFGPVIWFSLLMMTLLVASYAPASWLARALRLRAAPRPA